MMTASSTPQQILDVDNRLSLTDAAQQKGFDPAFIALVNFQQVLEMMAQHITAVSRTLPPGDWPANPQVVYVPQYDPTVVGRSPSKAVSVESKSCGRRKSANAAVEADAFSETSGGACAEPAPKPAPGSTTQSALQPQ